ncbi:hypothetical protein [Lentzea sp. NBRC 102530]|uniref:hypothetical protein n=1 Tax=Lentzea sp. NBRC 102530 TaxID=3032201 RepID=UPI0024A451B6|nr:hypothetical protein [Lentzea sp. NBRC 102530]GLY55336.1 hypothetical protein Lesp01_89910 [Lentzea sp. NBRC 102530]
MADVVTKVCDRCRKEIKPNPALGDLQGGPVEIAFPAFLVKLELCEECMDFAYVELGEYGQRIAGRGAAVGVDILKHLPVVPVE